MFPVTIGSLKIGDVIEYAVLTPTALVVDVTPTAVTILTHDFFIETIPYATGHWVRKVGYTSDRARWENRHTGKVQTAVLMGDSLTVPHRSTNGLRVAVIDIDGSTEVPLKKN